MMSEFLSLAALSATALTEGIKFLYGQAGELLRRRRERAPENVDPVQEETPPAVVEPRVLPAADLMWVGRFESELRALRADLQEYESGVDVVDPSDERLVRRVDALRRVLETIYGTPLIFAGESREAVNVRGRVDVGEVAGYVAAVRADRLAGNIKGYTRAHRVERGGEVIGVDLGTDRP